MLASAQAKNQYVAVICSRITVWGTFPFNTSFHRLPNIYTYIHIYIYLKKLNIKKKAKKQSGESGSVSFNLHIN